MTTIVEDKVVTAAEMHTVSDTIAKRENFQTQGYQWCCSKIFLCCSKRSNRDFRLFVKGQNRIDKDIDLRTYIKNIRNVQLLCNSLLNEKQRSLLHY